MLVSLPMPEPASRRPRFVLSRSWLPVGVAVATMLLWAIAFPPFNQAWSVLVFLVPFTKWAFARPKWRTYLLAAFGAGWGAWFVILIWLRHILPPGGWFGLLILSAYMGVYAFVWFVALRWAAPRLEGAPRWQRLAGLFALAAGWVVLDWVRGWLFTGFPWLPLAAAFWKFPLFLQPLQWTGSWSITFAIVLFNLGLVCGTGRESAADGEPPPRWRIFWPARLGWELLAPVVLFIAAVLVSSLSMNSHRRAVAPLMRVGIVQPAIKDKWNAEASEKNRDTLLDLTQTFAYRRGGKNNVDLIMWPEAALPISFQGTDATGNRRDLSKLVNGWGVPLLLGGIGEANARVGASVSPGIFDGVFLVQPGAGFTNLVYAKRHLVPFGEYIPAPFRRWLPFVGKVVPIAEDTVPGEQPVTLPLTLTNDRVVQVGPLVCYEDIFPGLARDEAKAGADVIAVVTNDTWYGTGGGSLQHAAHSVLRAIETRRPVIRCGNEGWSGFIDQDGNAFEIEKDSRIIKSEWVFYAHGTTYFRGTGAFIAYTNPQFDGEQTFYVRHGDWFVALCALLMVGGGALLWRRSQRS